MAVGVVLDTNVLVAAYCRRPHSPSFRILQLISREDVLLAISPDLFLEYEAVLKRPGILALTRMTLGEVESELDFLAMIGLEAHKHFRWRPNLTHESDNKLVECGITAGASLVITKNTRDLRQADLAHLGFEVVTPAYFMNWYNAGAHDV